MTENQQSPPREDEPDPLVRSGFTDQQITRRLDHARAELTGHHPVGDARLEALLGSGVAASPAGVPRATGPSPVSTVSTSAPTEEPPAVIVPLATGDDQGIPAHRRRLAIAAIAASFVLLVGGVVAATARGEDRSTFIGDSAAAAVEVGDDATSVDPGGPPADNTGSDSGSDGSEGSDGSDDTGSEGPEDPDHDLEGFALFGDLFGDELSLDHLGEFSPELQNLIDESLAWSRCVAGVVEDHLDGLGAHEPPLGPPPIGEECGEPPFAGADGLEGLPFLPFIFPPSGEDPFDGLFGDLELDELCDVDQGDDGVSIRCGWPKCDEDDCPSFGGLFSEHPGFPFLPDGSDGLEGSEGFEGLGEYLDRLEEHLGEYLDRFEEHLGEYFGDGTSTPGGSNGSGLHPAPTASRPDPSA